MDFVTLTSDKKSPSAALTPVRGICLVRAHVDRSAHRADLDHPALRAGGQTPSQWTPTNPLQVYDASADTISACIALAPSLSLSET
jgi:hypothetical protein